MVALFLTIKGKNMTFSLLKLVLRQKDLTVTMIILYLFVDSQNLFMLFINQNYK